MDVENMLEAEDKFDSLLKMEGNYFIMDSEQLIANPFQEMQQDVVNEAQKKNTMTERLTSVKNNVCENHFQIAQRRLERQKTQRLKQLHDHSNKLRHEVKLLDLDRQRHTVEIKKRLMPQRDFSYDDLQIINTEKRLGANIASFYLDKKMKYPTRLRSVSDISVTPTIRKARASIREQQIQKSLEDYLPESRQDRAATAKTNYSSLQKGSSRLARRRDSRSAPAYTRHGRYGNSDAKPPDSSTTLPAIDQEGRRDAWGTKSGSSQHPSPQQVKFAFENPLKILASSEESANLFAKAHPYYPGMVRAVNFGSDTSDDDDDDLYATEVIDLRAVLFGGTDVRATSVHSSPNCLTQQQLAAIRKAQGPAPKLTTDMKQEESNYINAKINTFLENLAMSRMRTRRDSDEMFADLDTDTVGYEGNPETAKVHSKSTSTGMMTDKDGGGGDDIGNTKSTSTIDLQGETQTFLSGASQAYHQPPSHDTVKNNDSHNPATPNVSKSTTTATTTIKDNNNNNNRNYNAERATKEEDLTADTPRKTKYSWRCIKGRPQNGELRGSYSAEDMVLQALTGVPLSNMLSGHVPLHSASRAMRHTATFKMHKIVEKLVNERTKYERHQVEELKRQMETEEQQADTQPSTSSRRTSNSSIGSRTSQVAAK